jgi:two-component system NtrC family sensor kinase
MVHPTLGTRLTLLAGLLVTLGLAALSVTLIGAHRRQIVDEAIHGSDNVAQMIRLSVTDHMLDSKADQVQQVIDAVATHAGVERIRLFNKEGEISYSSWPDEAGTMVDKKAEACFQCHDADKPIRHLSISDRSRIYRDADGNMILATISVIPNEKRCGGVDCHETADEKSVLGVLDVSVSMEPTEQRLWAATKQAISVSVAALVLTSLGLFLVIRSTVNRPLWNLINATRQVASGDFSQKVSPTAAAEIGILTRSFNQMVENMHISRARQHEGIETLKDALGKKSAEVRAAQYQAVQAEKLSAVGVIAAGVAHELNSPLMAIITFAHLVQKTVDSDSQEHQDLDMMVAEANRCAVIIRNLLDFSREQKPNQQLQLCAPAEILESVAKLIGPKLREHEIQVESLIDEDLPNIEVDPAQMTQVFLNLMLNAIQAMEAGGRLSILVDEVARDDFRNCGLPPDHGASLVRFRFRDTGSGISQQEMSRVFEPFFTTKPAGQGSGLGLSVSHGIVARHGGTILVDSDSQTWTEFTVLIPVAAES